MLGVTSFDGVQTSLTKKMSRENHNWEKRTKVFGMILVINSSGMKMGRSTGST